MAVLDKNRLLQAMNACVENGERLHEDAKCLVEAERETTAVALCILAQEEFAKAFLLHLVREGILPWTAKVRASLHNHKPKHLVGLIMEWLRPPDDEFFAWLKGGMGLEDSNKILPEYVSDAMKLYIEDVVPQGYISCPVATSDPIAKNIAIGERDKTKQDAFYVRISKDGGVISVPTPVRPEKVEVELETTERLSDLVSPLKNGALSLVRDFGLLVETMRFLLLEKRNRPFLLLKDSKFNGSVNLLKGTSWLHSITLLIENISAEQAAVVSGHTAVFLDEKLVEPLFRRFDQFTVVPYTTMLCTFGVDKETFDCGSSPSHKLALVVDLKYHGTSSDRKYHVHILSYYDPSAGNFKETLMDAQESMIGESQSPLETTLWSRRPTTR